MTTQLNTDNQNLEDELDKIIREFLNMQIVCMTLHHAACMEMSHGSMENGLIIFETTTEMRKSLEAERQKMLEDIGEEEVDAACERIGFKKTLYSSLSDAALKNSSLYIDVAPRPEGAEYVCNEEKFNLTSRMTVIEYFPELLAA